MARSAVAAEDEFFARRRAAQVLVLCPCDRICSSQRYSRVAGCVRGLRVGVRRPPKSGVPPRRWQRTGGTVECGVARLVGVSRADNLLDIARQGSAADIATDFVGSCPAEHAEES